MITIRRLRSPCRGSSRGGAIAVLTAFVLVALLAVSGLVLSLSYIELANAELKAATDAAARSAIIKLVITQSEDQGRAAAVDVAARYRVGGSPLQIAAGDVTFGKAVIQPDGSFSFQQSSHPLINAASVQGLKESGSSSGALSLPFGSLIGQETYQTQRAAIAMRLDYDIVLVLDRSGSMGWDLSQNRFSYPASKANRPLVENYFSPPDADAPAVGASFPHPSPIFCKC